jgi:hypothetical protein
MMQLDSLVLYGPGGDRRLINFRPGGLNIITGESGTGKTSIISILRFLLGSDSPHAPLGPIQRSVQWYGLLAHIGSTSFFIGRPAPAHGATTTQAFLAVGRSDVPSLDELVVNTSASEVRDYMGGLLGIEDNLNEPPIGQTRRPLAATFVHSLYYCFQGQGEVANPDILFHRQNREWQPQAIRDTLPYFLGAQGIDALRKREGLVRLRRELRRSNQALIAAEATREQGLSLVSGLLAAARQSGLTSRSETLTGWAQVLDALRAALETDGVAGEFSSDAGGVEDLIRRRSELRADLRANSEALRGLDDYANVEDGYVTELNEHRVRLASIGLIQELDEGARCPLCAASLADSSGSRSAISWELESVSRRLQSANRDRPRIETARQALLDDRQRLEGALADVDAALESIARTDELQASRRQAWQQQSFVRGRIAQFLESVAPPEDEELDRLRAAVEAVTLEIDALTSELDPEALRSRVNSILNVVGRKMTDWARTLELEHAEEGARIDPDRLTIVADTADGPAYMDTGEIGSGMNWVGYHLTAYLALQDFFIRRQRPVPSFIVIDQPSQAFFPRDRREGGELEELTDVDREHTRQLYLLMHNVTRELRGKLQLIAFDHADFGDAWFRESVIEYWRDGEALIPRHWYVEE